MVPGFDVGLELHSKQGRDLRWNGVVEIQASNYLKLYRLKASNMPNRCYDLGGGSGTEIRTAEGVNCGTMGVSLSSGNNAVNIEIHDGTGIGVSIGNQTVCDGCLVYRQTGATTDCFQASSIGAQIIRSVAAYCGRYGFNIAGNAGFSMIVTNSIAYGNATGFFGDQVQDGVSLYNNAGGNNSVANVTANDFPYNIGFVTLTADPFVSVSSSANGAANFALSTAAGGGALLRAAGLVGLAPSGNSTGYQDIGPMQHADPSGSGGQRSFTFLQ